MEFKFTEKEEDFYHEVEEFLKKELPPDWAEHNRTWPGGYGSNDLRYGTRSEIYKAYLKKLTEKGWITIRPLINILGAHHFNEVFFDNVRVPAENLVGQENEGFYYLMTALDFERMVVVGMDRAKPQSGGGLYGYFRTIWSYRRRNGIYTVQGHGAPRGYLDCISATIGAGTSEIQRNIIAQRGIGLPRR